MRVNGAAPGTTEEVAAGGVGPSADGVGAASYEETSDGVKLTVSEPVPAAGIFEVSITVAVSPRRLSVILLADESGFMV